MDTKDAERMLEMEEAAEGVDLFRAPGDEMRLEKARDQAEASGWIPEREAVVAGRPSVERARGRRRRLYSVADNLRWAISRGPLNDRWRADVDPLLAELGEALSAHIEDVEGPQGVLADIVEDEPRLAPEVEAIKEEHKELVEVWEGAREALHGGNGPETQFRAGRLLDLLSDHAERGAALVYEAYNLDIAATD